MYTDHSNPRISFHGKTGYLEEIEFMEKKGINDRFAGFFKRINIIPDDSQSIEGVSFIINL